MKKDMILMNSIIDEMLEIKRCVNDKDVIFFVTQGIMSLAYRLYSEEFINRAEIEMIDDVFNMIMKEN